MNRLGCFNLKMKTSKPYALLRSGFPYKKSLGMRRLTNHPTSVGIYNSKIYILCRSEGTATIRILTYDDEDLGTIGKYGSDSEEHLLWPNTIKFDKDGNLFISDEGKHKIIILSETGKFIKSWGIKGDKEGQFNRPSGICFTSKGNLIVSDTLNHRIQEYTPDGNFVRQFGENGTDKGQFNMPWGVATDSKDNIYVSDWKTNRIQKFSYANDYIFSIGEKGTNNGFFNQPTYLEVDPHDDLYVSDTFNNRVQQFNENGMYLDKFTGNSSLSKSGIDYLLSNAYPMRLREMTSLEEQKLLRKPRGLAFDNDLNLFICDYWSYRVQIYQKQTIPLKESDISPPIRSSSLLVT